MNNLPCLSNSSRQPEMRHAGMRGLDAQQHSHVFERGLVRAELRAAERELPWPPWRGSA